MFCQNCGAEISDNLNFCTKCGARIEHPAATVQAAPPARPVQPAPVVPPVQPAVPQQPVPPITPAAPTAAAPAVKSKKPFNPLFVIIPAAVILLAGLAALYFLLFSKPAAAVSDLEKALEDGDFRTAFEISEQLPEDECEKVIEDYIKELLSADEADLAKNDKLVQKMFSKGFDKYKKIYKNYKNGKYTPEQSTDAEETSQAEPEQNASVPEQTTAAPTQAPQTEPTPVETSAPEEPVIVTVEPEPTLSERVVGHWSRKIRSGWFEDVVFLDDGTGYIYSDLVSEKVSDTNSDYLYYDGKIHFDWWADDRTVYIDAAIDPYCFVAYQGYAADGHYSSATWKGSKNGSHDYYFGYDTEEEYLNDMLGTTKSNYIYSYDSLTSSYWIENLAICEDAWDKYFHHSDQMDYDKYKIDYSTLADRYYASPELRAQYEDVDLYHFVPFTKMVLLASGNPITISLTFDMEDYERE